MVIFLNGICFFFMFRGAPLLLIFDAIWGGACAGAFGGAYGAAADFLENKPESEDIIPLDFLLLRISYCRGIALSFIDMDSRCGIARDLCGIYCCMGACICIEYDCIGACICIDYRLKLFIGACIALFLENPNLALCYVLISKFCCWLITWFLHVVILTFFAIIGKSSS